MLRVYAYAQHRVGTRELCTQRSEILYSPSESMAQQNIKSVDIMDDSESVYDTDASLERNRHDSLCTHLDGRVVQNSSNVRPSQRRSNVLQKVTLLLGLDLFRDRP
ncbi:hypothetical protein QCA50_016771 [Cerrena zonata]|uniref:Uncharacterized protein n=1 Tax=Cerrena zonata TaxID=2478898 RepID=A0AAW0FSI2_9APHY